MPFRRLACGWPAVFKDAVRIRDAMLVSRFYEFIRKGKS